jgi:heat shock protein HslJ
MIGAIVACAHAAQSNEAGNPLTGSRWQLQMLGPTAVLESAKPTLEFAPSDRVSGMGSCNRFNGTVTVSGKSITFGPLATTRMACADPINRQEATYFKALTEAEWFLIHDATLTVYTKAMDQPLVFVRSEGS